MRSRVTTTQRLSTPTQRAQARGRLLHSSVARSTAHAYTVAVDRFLAYCPHRGRHTCHSHLDQCVQDYICHLNVIYTDRNRQLAVNAVYGLYMLHPELRRQLRGSEGLLAAWQRLVPSVSHPPLTWTLTIAIARTMAENGFGECAIAALVTFDGMLRVGELVAIRVSDVSFPLDDRRGGPSLSSSQSISLSSHPMMRQSSSVFIRLAVTKTGTNQTAEIRNTDIIALLRRHIATRPSNSRLFGLPSVDPAAYFRTVLRSACCALDIGEFGFTPHSLRHGGATHANMHMGETIEHVLHSGRWRSNSSARVYLQSGAAALIATQLSELARHYQRGLQIRWVEHLWSDCYQSQPLSS